MPSQIGFFDSNRNPYCNLSQVNQSDSPLTLNTHEYFLSSLAIIESTVHEPNFIKDIKKNSFSYNNLSLQFRSVRTCNVLTKAICLKDNFFLCILRI